MRAGKVAGIQIVISNWFLVLLIIFLLAGMAGKLMLAFISVIIHELAHICVARFLGYQVGTLELLPFGGVAHIYNLGKASAGQEILIALAGPAVSLVITIVSYLSAQGIPQYRELLQFIYDTNFMLATFNMLPALPLDGGRIVRAWLSLFYGHLQATIIAVKCTKIICLLLIVITGWLFYDTRTLNITFVVAVLFLYLSVRAEISAARLRNMQILAQKKALLLTQGAMQTIHLTVLSHVKIKDILKLFKEDYYYVVLVVNPDFHLQGAITETEVWESLPLKGIFTEIGDFL